jgi:hypothetical protein
MSLTWAAVVITLSGVPRPSHFRSRPHTRGPCPVPRRIQSGEQDSVQPVEDSGLLPSLQAAPAGLTGAEPQLRRQQLPGDVVDEIVFHALRPTMHELVYDGPACRAGGALLFAETVDWSLTGR